MTRSWRTQPAMLLTLAIRITPAMTAVFEFGPLSAIGLFPVLSREEMRAAPGDNELADIPDSDMADVWAALMQRLGAIDRYRELFEAAYPGTRFDDMSFAHASNAMAGFMLDAFVFDNTPWDRFLAGADPALTRDQLEGASNFLNAPCAQCHNGPGFSDDDFHNVALAQFGPGHGNGPSGRDDFGRMNKEQIIATRDFRILPVAFDAEFTRQVTAFMLALTDHRARDLSSVTPSRVPSGLPVDR